MPAADDDLSAQVERFLKLHKQGLINDADLRAALRGLGLSADDITRIERQINVAGDYVVQAPSPAPDSLPRVTCLNNPSWTLR